MRPAQACLIVLLVTLSLGALLLFVGCNKVLDDMCGNEIIRTVSSPDGKVKAVVFGRDCGATTGFSTQVSLLASGNKLPNEPGNVFDAEIGHGHAPSGPGGGPDVKVVWKNNQTLLLTYHPKAQVYGHERRATVRTGWFSRREVTIEYRQVK